MGLRHPAAPHPGAHPKMQIQVCALHTWTGSLHDTWLTGCLVLNGGWAADTGPAQVQHRVEPGLQEMLGSRGSPFQGPRCPASVSPHSSALWGWTQLAPRQLHQDPDAEPREPASLRMLGAPEPGPGERCTLYPSGCGAEGAGIPGGPQDSLWLDLARTGQVPRQPGGVQRTPSSCGVRRSGSGCGSAHGSVASKMPGSLGSPSVGPRHHLGAALGPQPHPAAPRSWRGPSWGLDHHTWWEHPPDHPAGTGGNSSEREGTCPQAALG